MMTTPQATPEAPKNKSCFLWGCLIVLALICLVFACLVSIVGLSFAGIDPLGLNLENQIDKFRPWQDYYKEPGIDSYYEDKDLSPEDEYEEPSIDFGSDSGLIQLAPYQSDLITFNFFYPEGWEIDPEEAYEAVGFTDPYSNTRLSVSKDWLCNGCLTAEYASEHYKDVLLMESGFDSFEVIESIPYYLPAGEDAHYGVYQWLDLDGNFQWTYNVIIASGEDMISFILRGDDPILFEQYGDLVDKVADSFNWK